MEQSRLEVGGVYYDGQGVLFNGFSGNGLFYWDIVKNQTYFLEDFHRDPVWRGQMFYRMVKRENFYFFLPFMAQGIPYFDIDTRKIMYCSLPACLENRLLNYYGYAEEGSLLYLFPVDPFKEALVLDMEHREVSGILSGWNKNLINKLCRNGESLMNGFAYQDGKAWLSYGLTEGVFELQLHSWNVQNHMWNEIAQPVILQTNDNGLWIEDQGRATAYHVDTFGRITERYRLKTENNRDYQRFSRVIRLNSGIRIILPSYADQLLIIDGNQHVHCRRLEKNIDGTEGRYLCYHYLEFEEEVWLLPHSQNDIIVIELHNYEIQYKKLPLPEEWLRISAFISKMKCCDSRFVVEQDQNDITLQDLCDYLKNKREDIEEKKQMKSYGAEIWRQVSKRKRRYCDV